MKPVNELSEKFHTFVEEQWDVDEAYTIADFHELFGIDIRLARYYLVKLVDEGLLFYLRWNHNVYYAKSCWFGPFQRFAHNRKVKIRRGSKVCR